ncbi:histone-lysine N-trimethyltransferase SMYD5 [Sphaerodactylus townsendi]|uniref:histone-lysine N-trimethyltransferase SMYD5 n=1 Tax=Sphaerodactylus townsendi TaxID=933632 RepID=UPI002026B3FC|nr:histone-lysine N-trimethyltransferase SMYD5 [Sphaerodactylus townsendi]
MAAPVCSHDAFAGGPEAGGQARRALEVRFVSSAKGKGLFATRNIRKGETIFVEKPVVSAQFLWNALYKYKACDHCLRALETAEENAQRLLGRFLALPHPEQCSIRKDLHQLCPSCQVVYCSPECRQAAWDQYHQVLCLGPSREDPSHPLNKLQEAWRNIHYPPETSSIMLMARMVATVKQAKDKDWWIKVFSQFCSKTANEEEEIVHKLLGEKFKGQLEVLRVLFTEALYDEHLSKWFSPEGFRSLFALVGTNGQGMGTSSLSQWVHACDSLELPPKEREQLDAFIDQLYKDIEKVWGRGCGPVGRAFALHVEGPRFDFWLLQLKQQVVGGVQVLSLGPYQDRQDQIRCLKSCIQVTAAPSPLPRENYLFTCSCPKCLTQASDPDVTSEEEEEEGEGDPDDAELEDEMTDV